MTVSLPYLLRKTPRLNPNRAANAASDFLNALKERDQRQCSQIYKCTKTMMYVCECVCVSVCVTCSRNYKQKCGLLSSTIFVFDRLQTSFGEIILKFSVGMLLHIPLGALYRMIVSQSDNFRYFIRRHQTKQKSININNFFLHHQESSCF